MDFEIQAASNGAVGKQCRTRAVGKHPAQEVFFKADFGRGVVQQPEIGFALEYFATHHGGGVFRCGGDGGGVFACFHSLVGVFHRRHARNAHARQRYGFARRHIAQTVHHHAVPRHSLVGVGRGAGKAGGFAGFGRGGEQQAQGFGGEFGIGVGGSAGFGVNRVVARGDAVGAQNHAAHARGNAARHAEHGFHLVVGNGGVGQEGGGAGKIDFVGHIGVQTRGFRLPMGCWLSTHLGRAIWFSGCLCFEAA